MRNMSTVEPVHPHWAIWRAHCLNQLGVVTEASRQPVEVWSYSQLAKVLDFSGCEVLMIDAEGHDVRILRSVIEHCRRYPRELPWLVQFETMGHCDRAEGGETSVEWNVIWSLMEEGYLLVHYSHRDSHSQTQGHGAESMSRMLSSL